MQGTWFLSFNYWPSNAYPLDYPDMAQGHVSQEG